MSQFQRLEEVNLNSCAASKPKIGYLCLRVPIEYLEAAGAVPLRIVPRPGYDTSGYSPIRTDGCSFCRSVPAILNTENYRDLSAIIAGSCCDQMRRLTEVLQNQLDVPVFLFGAPRTWQTDQSYFQAEMTQALNRISEITGHHPSEADFRAGIAARNALKKTVLRLRDEEKLPTGILHQIAASPLPPAKIVQFIKRYENRSSISADIRLLLVGSIPGVWELEVIETDGARIVADTTCLGDRVFSLLTDESGDPIDRLYESYIEENLCPHRRPVTPLVDYIRDLATERAVDGIVYRSVKYCHPWSLLAERIKSELRLPFLQLDDDLTSPAVGNLHTRVGAFIEMLNMRTKQSA